jgi:hypothetical protein
LLSDTAYPYILALNLVAIAFKLVREFRGHDMGYLYLEYLADYDLGFIRRGLVPELLSWIAPRLTWFDVKVFAVVLALSTLIAYGAAYAIRFGLRRNEWPLLVVAVASPCVFKNFAYDFARLDGVGFIVACLALALPLGRFYVPALALLSAVLLLVHEALLLTCLPAIATIAVLRKMAAPPVPMRSWWPDFIAVVAVLAVFGLIYRFGNAGVPPDVFLAHLHSRAVDPFYDRIFIWYSSVADNVAAAAQSEYLRAQLRSIPLYLLIIAVHVPLLMWVRGLIRDEHIRGAAALLCGAGAVTLGFCVIAVISHDRARFFAQWIAYLVLVALAVRPPQSSGDDLAPLRTPVAVAAAWAMTVMPRVGLMTPF